MMIRTQVFLMTFVLLAFASASFFSFPQADDFSYSFRVINLGFWDAQISQYMNWTGRYFATIFLSLSPLVWGTLTVYRFLPILIILMLFLSSVFLVKMAFNSRLRRHEEYFWGLSLTYLMLVSFHTISEGIYWQASSYTYTLAIVFFNLGLGFILKKKPNYYFASFFAFVICGCNETSMVLWIYALGVIGAYRYLTERKLPAGLIATVIVSLIGATLMLASPGNSIRAGYFPKSHDAVRTISNALLYSFIDPFKFLTIPVIVFTLLNFSRIKEIFASDFWKKHKYFMILAMMGLFFISFSPSLWGMGRRPNTRTMNVIVHCYLLLLFPVVLAFLKEIKLQKWMRYSICFLVVSFPTYDVVKDFMSGSIFVYPDMWKKNIKSKGQITFEKAEAPKTLHFKFIEEPIELDELNYLNTRAGFYPEDYR